jgi:uncharacterized membrane protein
MFGAQDNCIILCNFNLIFYEITKYDKLTLKFILYCPVKIVILNICWVRNHHTPSVPKYKQK